MIQIEEASLMNFFLISVCVYICMYVFICIYIYIYKHVYMYYYAMKRKIFYHIPQSRMNFECIILSELCQRK